MDTLEWTLWPARWAILLIGLLAQLAALVLAVRREGARACSTLPSPQRACRPESSPSPDSKATYDFTPAMAAAPGPPAGAHEATPGDYPDEIPPRMPCVFRISRGLLLTGGALVATFALLERDMLLLAGQMLALPLLWPRQR
ncbi:hypothetical protein [Nitratidesulfovibrio termitidis]|uniref:hypothetical protein n=1 Tax=Nitratidesulfovibrio termitidis TaxID=42252 RepID=UPI0003F96A3F|nr:hypothetical protein [Nitratidesulfovibrio termitidis]